MLDYDKTNKAFDFVAKISHNGVFSFVGESFNGILMDEQSNMHRQIINDSLGQYVEVSEALRFYQDYANFHIFEKKYVREMLINDTDFELLSSFPDPNNYIKSMPIIIDEIQDYAYNQKTNLFLPALLREYSTILLAYVIGLSRQDNPTCVFGWDD